MGYHLWLMPTNPAKERLTQTIAALGREYGAPLFEPHVTLVGELPGTEAEILRRAFELAHDLHHLEIRPNTVDFTDRYFQCLFLHVELTLPLRAAHGTARRLFSRDSEAPYMPHVSLLYGIYSVAVKQQIIAMLPHEIMRPFAVEQLHLIRADSENPKDWHPIRVLPFGGYQG